MRKNKLTDMNYTSVDLVRAGANQDAHIALFKSDGEQDTEYSVLKKAFDYLRNLFSDSPGVTDPPQVKKITKSDIRTEYDGYMEALAKSFDLIMDDEEMESEEKAEMMRKSLAEFHTFMVPAVEKWADMNSIAKSDQSLETAIEKHEEQDEIRKYLDALTMSVDSILNDDTLPDIQKSYMLDQSVDEFSSAFKKSAAITLKTDPENNPEKEDEKMDMSNLTEEEQKTMKALMEKAKCKKACGSGDPEVDKACGGGKSDCKKSADEMYVPDFVKNAIAKSEEFITRIEKQEMAEIAKKYEILGEKPDELGEKLYNLKKSDPDMYESCISMLDNQVGLIEKSGLFSEIGKSGNGGYTGSDAVSKIESIAKSMMDEDATLSYQQAMAKAWDNHPELVAEYEG